MVIIKRNFDAGRSILEIVIPTTYRSRGFAVEASQFEIVSQADVLRCPEGFSAEVVSVSGAAAQVKVYSLLSGRPFNEVEDGAGVLSGKPFELAVQGRGAERIAEGNPWLGVYEILAGRTKWLEP